MKNLFLFLIFGACFLGVNAQYWSLTGNTGTTVSDFVGTKDPVPLIFKTNDVERMRLLEDKAFLGIGTPAPLVPLHLHVIEIGRTTPLMQITTNNLINGLQVFTNSNSSDLHFKHRENANFYIEGSGGGLTIAPDGNIGVGIYQPQAKLDVNGSLKVKSINLTESNLNNGFNMYYIAQNLYFTQREQGDFYISGSGGGLMIAPDGNIGVGMYQPQAKLDVDGSFKAQTAEITGTFKAQTANITDSISANLLKANLLKVQTADITGTLTTNNMAIIGNLGLGTNTPEQKLHIKDGNMLVTRTPKINSGLEKSAIIFDFESAPNNMTPNSKWGIEYVNSSTDGKGLNFWKGNFNNGPNDKDSTRGWEFS